MWVNGAGMLVAICRWFFETFGKGIESGEEVTRGSGEVEEGACFSDMLSSAHGPELHSPTSLTHVLPDCVQNFVTRML